MFESDDWDLDQDFLNDVDNRSNNISSTTDNDEIEPKKRKIEVSNDSAFSSHNNVNWGKEKFSNETITQHSDKALRKNLILGVFNKSTSESNLSKKLTENSLLKSQLSNTRSISNNQLSRTNSVLEILGKKSSKDKVTDNNVENSDSRNNKAKIQDKSNIFIKQQNNSKEIASENSRKELSNNTLKQCRTSNVELKNKCTLKTPQVQSNKKMTLVRRFPGPAGLLPDNIDVSTLQTSYLNTLNESESTKEFPKAALTEYCSQNTENLFTEGAWQLMLDDLPDGFLKGKEIATVKQMASINGHSCTKVDFLAGIIECIDYSRDNPLIVLKDFTDKMPGIVHKDIPYKYPGLLDSNVVILLRNVGLLKTSGSFVSNKYHILISPSSLLAIYSNKGKIERTRYMESIVRNVYNGEAMEEKKDMEEDEVFLNRNSESNVNCTVGNDSDDEMLSQLDMEAICSNGGLI
ncbi:uncharacterized protein LOC116433998 [Nomia melanderi]|uniref:uncharacterized protein LOC116433998 n=1 Tax=Nomia melanderi TaxID=2448451 RepID=UPI003FCED698